MRLQAPRFLNSIVTRLVIVGLLLVIVGSLARFYFLTTWLREDLKDLVVAERLALANHIAGAINYQLVERQALLERVSSAVPLDLLDRPEELRAWLEQRNALLPFFSLGLEVLDRKGAAVAGSAPPSGIDVSGPAGPAVDAGLTAALRGKVTLVIREASKQPALSIAVPIRGMSGEIRGALIGIGAISDLHAFGVAEQGSVNHGGLLLISPRDHLFVSSTDPAMVLQPTPPRGINLLHDRAMEGYRGTGITVNAAGIEEISAMVSVPAANWFVVARTPTSDAFFAVERTKSYVLRSSIGALLFVSLFVSGLIWWVLKPLFVAARQADAMTRGDVPLQALEVVRDDEVGHLTTAFNRLLTKLAKSQLELSELAHHDPLTGLPNRRLLADRLAQTLARCKRNGTSAALLVMDLDGFKQINDAYGHEAGDEVLRAFAQRFDGLLRQDDTLARFGGDEFVLLAGDLTGSPDVAAEAIAAKCIAIASQPFVNEGVETRLGLSVGIALCSGDCDPQRLMDMADQAMYQAKQTGRGRYVFAKDSGSPAKRRLRAGAAR